MNRSEHFVNRGSHEHNDKDDFRTPPYLWDWIKDQWGPIHYDGACTPGVNNLAEPLRLEDRWHRYSTVFSNPPFDSKSIEAWFEKGEVHSAEGGVHIMLLPDKLCQVFMSRMIPKFSEIVFLGGRVNFISPYAVKGGTSMNGSIITVQTRNPENHSGPSISSFLLRDLTERYSLKERFG